MEAHGPIGVESVASVRPFAQRNAGDRTRGTGKRAHPELGMVSAAALMRKVLPEIQYIVPGYIAEGLTLLGGKAKLGKSWLLLGTAIAVASGGIALNSIPVEQGDVLALFLEDNERRLQKRLRQLRPNGDVPERLCIDTTAPRLDEGLLDYVERWAKRVPRARLLIVDVLNRVRPPQRNGEQLYDYDVRCLEGLQRLAATYGLAVVVCHHTRKAEAEDPFDCLSGSTGLTGTADTTLVLARDSQGTTLYGRGRDVEEIESALLFDKTNGHWTLLGDTTDVRRSDERSVILDTLAGSGAPLGPQEIADISGANAVAVRKMLARMVKDGEIYKLSRGAYSTTPGAPRERTPKTPRHNGHNVTKGGSRHDQ